MKEFGEEMKDVVCSDAQQCRAEDDREKMDFAKDKPDGCRGGEKAQAQRCRHPKGRRQRSQKDEHHERDADGGHGADEGGFFLRRGSSGFCHKLRPCGSELSAGDGFLCGSASGFHRLRERRAGKPDGACGGHIEHDGKGARIRRATDGEKAAFNGKARV